MPMLKVRACQNFFLHKRKAQASRAAEKTSRSIGDLHETGCVSNLILQWGVMTSWSRCAQVAEQGSNGGGKQHECQLHFGFISRWSRMFYSFVLIFISVGVISDMWLNVLSHASSEHVHGGLFCLQRSQQAEMNAWYLHSVIIVMCFNAFQLCMLPVIFSADIFHPTCFAFRHKLDCNACCAVKWKCIFFFLLSSPCGIADENQYLHEVCKQH